LIAVSVLAPVVVGGAAFILLAKALAGSWLWGLVAVTAFALACTVGVVLMRRWAMRNPEAAEGFLASWGRAMAFGSGGWEPTRKGDETKQK
jgi:ABC-type nitrate/sulfonate/bicarbonate transport system substrate-binding protein